MAKYKFEGPTSSSVPASPIFVVSAEEKQEMNDRIATLEAENVAKQRLDIIRYEKLRRLIEADNKEATLWEIGQILEDLK